MVLVLESFKYPSGAHPGHSPRRSFARKPRFTFSERLFFDRYKEKLTNEYVIREVRKILKSRFGYSEFQINGAIDSIRLRCEVCLNPPPNRFKKLEIRDKSDKPIVQGAIDNKCTLVTGDYNTYHDTHCSRMIYVLQ